MHCGGGGIWLKSDECFKALYVDRNIIPLSLPYIICFIIHSTTRLSNPFPHPLQLTDILSFSCCRSWYAPFHTRLSSAGKNHHSLLFGLQLIVRCHFLRAFSTATKNILAPKTWNTPIHARLALVKCTNESCMHTSVMFMGIWVYYLTYGRAMRFRVCLLQQSQAKNKKTTINQSDESV